MEPKIREVRGDDRAPPGWPTASTSRSTAASGPPRSSGAAAAGANVLVAGSALFRDPHGLAHAVAELAPAVAAADGRRAVRARVDRA